MSIQARGSVFIRLAKGNKAMPRYGSIEFAHAEPFAKALVTDSAFRSWVLRHTRFQNVADEAILLDEEMQAKRGKGAASWWRSYYTERCRCRGCSGQETDLLAIFEDRRKRFALHFEVKQPTDRFPADKDQAGNYAIRAKCWIKSPPKAVLQHDDADTVLLCSAAKLTEYASHISRFGSVITFEEVGKCYPRAVAVPSSLDVDFNDE